MALEETVKFLGQSPESVDGHCLLALIHAKEARKTEAVRAARTAVELSPGWSHPYYVLGFVLYLVNEHQTALIAMKECLRLDPSHADAYEIVSSIHSRLGKNDDALKLAGDGLAHQPEHVGCLFQRGFALNQLDRRAEGEIVFRTLLSIDPEHAPTHCFLGRMLIEQGNFNDALQHLRQSLRIDPESTVTQEAWKEALCGRYASYAIVHRFRKWFFVDCLQYSGSFCGGIVLLIYKIIQAKNEGQGWIMAAVLALGIVLLVLAGIFAILTGYLSLVSQVLLVTDNQLRLTQDRKSIRRKWIVIVFVCVVLYLSIYVAIWWIKKA